MSHMERPSSSTKSIPLLETDAGGDTLLSDVMGPPSDLVVEPPSDLTGLPSDLTGLPSDLTSRPPSDVTSRPCRNDVTSAGNDVRESSVNNTVNGTATMSGDPTVAIVTDGRPAPSAPDLEVPNPPWYTTEQYDAVIFYSIGDQLIAEALQYDLQELCHGNELDVEIKCFHDHIGFGGQLTTEATNLLKQSNFWFFLISENFCEDELMKLVHDDSIYEQCENVRNFKYSRIPVYTNSDLSGRIPLARGIKGLCYSLSNRLNRNDQQLLLSGFRRERPKKQLRQNDMEWRLQMYERDVLSAEISHSAASVEASSVPAIENGGSDSTESTAASGSSVERHSGSFSSMEPHSGSFSSMSSDLTVDAADSITYSINPVSADQSDSSRDSDESQRHLAATDAAGNAQIEPSDGERQSPRGRHS